MQSLSSPRLRASLLLLLALCLGAAPRPAQAEERADGLRWVGVDPDGRLLFETAVGRVTLAPSALEKDPARLFLDLQATVARAAGAGLRGTEEAPWIWGRSDGVGAHLLGPEQDWLALPDALLRRIAMPGREGETERGDLLRAADALRAEIDRTAEISPWMAGALGDILKRLPNDPGDPASAELDPSFARRVVADPRWLPQVAGAADPTLRADLMEALRSALRLTPSARFEGEGRQLTQVRDAWGPQGVALLSPDGALFMRTPAPPMDDGARMDVLKRASVLVRLPQGADPLADPTSLQRAQEVRLECEGTVLASWSKAAGFQAEDEVWREWFPLPGGTYLKNQWPPHIAITDATGTLQGLAVPGGILRPVRDHGPEEAQRFLDDAARLLPDAAHLDLLQQYFLRYVWDSPDLTQPLMLGCEKFHDEIHQTSDQILDTCAGGICRGDCDDVAEFIQDIARRQGKLAHVVNLPGHLAAVWAEKHGEKWRTFVLQSGPAHEFERDDLPSALEAAYLYLDENAPFDRNNVGVSLRFAGQNTRSTYGLSWRIFEDPEYARLMIDVQADWNRMTLLRAERKMLQILKTGDTSTANYQELSALYSWMSRPEEALRYDRLSLQSRTDAESALIKAIELIDNLLEAEKNKEAEEYVEKILTRVLPPLTKAIGLRALVIGQSLAATLAEDAPGLSLRVLSVIATLKVESLGATLSELLDPSGDGSAWRAHASNEAIQSLLHDYAWTALTAFEKQAEGVPPPGPVLIAGKVLDVWLRLHAFDDADEPDEIAQRWSLRARRLAIGVPDFLERVAKAKAPTTLEGADLVALSAAAGEAEILSWARAAPPFFTYLASEKMADEAVHPDPAEMQRLGVLLHEAEGHARRLGIFGPDSATEERRIDLCIALLTKDEAALRRALREARALDDRYILESTSGTLGWAAAHLDLDWWKTIVQAWIEEVDNPVNAFNIVWRAVTVKATAHALYAAEAAAAHYPDDAAIQEEAALFRARSAR